MTNTSKRTLVAALATAMLAAAAAAAVTAPPGYIYSTQFLGNTTQSCIAAGPGGAPSKDCLHETYGLQVTGGAATCTDGSPCDSDGVVNGACVFPVGFCLNVPDPNLSACDTSSSITTVAISANPASAAINAAAAQVTAALPLSGSSCFFSDGYYVPVKVTGSGTKKDGRAKVKIAVEAADGRKDTDTVKLICHPAA